MTDRAAGVVGPGRVGLSLAAALQRSGRFRTVRVTGPSADPPPFLEDRSAIEYLPLPAALERVAGGEPLAGGDGELPAWLLFAVPDEVLAGAAGEWADASEAGGARWRVALHTSGVRPAAALGPLRDAGEGRTPVAGLHPLRAIPAPDPGALQDAAFGLEGDPEAVELGGRLARWLGGRPLRVRAGEKARYHAGAVMASNFLVACLAAAHREVEAATDGETRIRDLLPLARSALAGVEGRGPGEGLTGPLTRGDLETVRAHLQALDSPGRDLYACVTRVLGELATLGPEERRELRRMTGEEE